MIYSAKFYNKTIVWCKLKKNSGITNSDMKKVEDKAMDYYSKIIRKNIPQ
jgi:hypothetical protein